MKKDPNEIPKENEGGNIKSDETDEGISRVPHYLVGGLGLLTFLRDWTVAMGGQMESSAIAGSLGFAMGWMLIPGIMVFEYHTSPSKGRYRLALGLSAAFLFLFIAGNVLKG